MSRDPWKLKVFLLADELVVRVYRATRGFPTEERFGLQAQLRRASVSVPTNLVEGRARRTLRDHLHFVGIAVGSASEVRYLVGISQRLGLLDEGAAADLSKGYSELVRGLQTLVSSLESRA